MASSRLMAPPKRRVFGLDQKPFGLNQKPFGFDLEEDDEYDVLLPWEISIKRGRFSPISIMLTGRRDVGKTYSMTILLDLMRKRYVAAGLMPPNWPRCPDMAKSRWKIVTNYWTNISISDQRIIEGVIRFEPWVFDMLLGMDELQTELFNRRAMARENVGMSTFLTMIRKRRIDCVFTTQTPTQIDPNVLFQTDLFVQVVTQGDYSNNGRTAFGRRSTGREWVLFHCYDWQGQWGGRGMVNRRLWPPPLSMADWVRPLYVPNPWHYFRMYNTDEVHASRYMGKDVQEHIIATEEARSGNESNLNILRDAYSEAEQSYTDAEARLRQTLDTAQKQGLNLKDLFNGKRKPQENDEDDEGTEEQ